VLFFFSSKTKERRVLFFPVSSKQHHARTPDHCAMYIFLRARAFSLSSKINHTQYIFSFCRLTRVDSTRLIQQPRHCTKYKTSRCAFVSKCRVCSTCALRKEKHRSYPVNQLKDDRSWSTTKIKIVLMVDVINTLILLD